MNTVKVSIVGDIMCEPYLIRSAKKDGGYDFSALFEGVNSLLSQSDYVIGNLETPITGQNDRLCSNLYLFNAPLEFAAAVKKAGIEFVVTANNHCLDQGVQGLDKTIDNLDKLGINHCGTSHKKESRIGYFTINGIKIAVVGGTSSTNYSINGTILPEDRSMSVNLLCQHKDIYFLNNNVKASKIHRIERFMFRAWRKMFRIIKVPDWKRQQINKIFHVGQTKPFQDNFFNDYLEEHFNLIIDDLRTAKEHSDIVVFYPHMGGQFNEQPGSFSEFVVKTIAKTGLCDLIVSSHPHVIQKARVIENIPCFYSIGNFSMSPNSYYIPNQSDPDWGIIVHVYIDDAYIKRITFSIIHIIENKKGMMKIIHVDEQTDLDLQLYSKIKHIYELVTGKSANDHFVPQSEYELEFGRL